MNNQKEKTKKSNIIGNIGKIIKAIFLIVAILLLTMAATIMYKANKYPDKIPDVLGYKPMIVLSGSMESSIKTGDLVIVKMVDENVLKVNDIIAFRNETNTVTTHRIVEIVEEDGETCFRTKGDNNNIEDANLVKPSAVEGVYVAKINGLGNFLMFIQQPIGLAIMLLIVLVIGLIWLYIVNSIEEKKISKEYEAERKEFEEYKKMKKAINENNQKTNDKKTSDNKTSNKKENNEKTDG